MSEHGVKPARPSYRAHLLANAACADVGPLAGAERGIWNPTDEGRVGRGLNSPARAQRASLVGLQPFLQPPPLIHSRSASSGCSHANRLNHSPGAATRPLGGAPLTHHAEGDTRWLTQ
jgi:hypothetical protein